MPTTVVNYDGSIATTPRQLVYPEDVADIQSVLRDTARYPSPVRAKGSYHSLTPCASTDGTLVDMSRLTRVIAINAERCTLTAQAGLQIIDAAKALRAEKLQLMTNIEIGNMTLGSAACCHTKDALDGVEFGQVASYVTGMRWVTPSGGLAEASESEDPELMRMMRSSYGLGGIIYEVTLQVKPIEALHFTYVPRSIDQLTQAEVDSLLDSSEGLVCWTLGRTCVFQVRHRVADAGIFGALEAAARRELWSFGEAHVAHLIDAFARDSTLRSDLQALNFDVDRFLYSTLHLFGGLTVLAPDKIIDYRKTPPSARYAFSFWAFPRSRWLETLRQYLDFCEEYFERTGFRCNMPLGAYHIRQDTRSLLSYSFDEEVFSIDPIHASTDDAAWHAFLRAFNEFAYQHDGTPLLNQSPFVERKHVQAAWGQRWATFSKWTKTVDPTGRMVNPFFADLLEG